MSRASSSAFDMGLSESTLNAALRYFEGTEANLVKAEKLLEEIGAAIPAGPAGIVFGENPDYERNCRYFDALVESLPLIDDWKPAIHLLELDEIAQSRLDAQDLGEIEFIASTERRIYEPERLLREYRHRFDQKRRELIREALVAMIDAIDSNLRILSHLTEDSTRWNKKVTDEEFESLKQNVDQINVLLGSSVPRPARWMDLNRHLHFGMAGDLHDIIKNDWPLVRSDLRKSLYGEKEPIPVEIEDLGVLVGQKPNGPVATKLKWQKLDEEGFERLVFALISSEQGYENPEWLTRTNATDRGRDLQVQRTYTDPLAGTIRHRVIIQCKHWLTKSVGLSEIVLLKEQMRLWEPPRVDVHIVATSGRFSTDAVEFIEKHNQSDSALRIEMWAESHLERLLAARPAIIAEFSLR